MSDSCLFTVFEILVMVAILMFFVTIANHFGYEFSLVSYILGVIMVNISVFISAVVRNL